VGPLRLICLLFALAASLAAAGPAGSLYRQARKAQSKGDYTKAFLLANRAVALDPNNLTYWSFAQAVRTRGMDGLKLDLGAQPLPEPAPEDDPEAQPEPELEPIGAITDADYKHAREARPVPVLAGKPGRQNFNLRGDAKSLFARVAEAFGLSVVFDNDYQPGRPVQFEVTQMDYREALRALEEMTSSFLIPVSNRLALVAKDTTQKRVELEPVMSVIVPYPEPISPQEVQEAARAVQSSFDMTKVGIDNAHRQVLFRDRVSRLKPALEIFRQLMLHRGQVVTEVEFLSINRDSATSAGLTLQKTIPLVLYGTPGPFSSTGSTATYPSLGAGDSRFGVGVASADLVASYSRGRSQSLLRTDLRAIDGQAANLHVGDRYPIITSRYSGASSSTSSSSSAYGTAPSVTFEDLGVVLKVTPHLHGVDGVTLEIETEMKSLTGTTLNDIPVISNRKFSTKVRLSFDEAAVISGLTQDLLTQSWSGMPPVSALAPLRKNDKSFTGQELLLTVRPRLVSLPPTEFETQPVWSGTETRSRSPLD